MPLIAVTGGIASGKSTISARLAELGAVVVDADALTKELQAPGAPVTTEIAATFGADVLDASGRLQRSVLASRVFGDSEALQKLNAIVHPAVRQASAERFREAFADDPKAVVVYDVPLLAEARGTAEWDLVVVADTPAEARVERLVTLRGYAREDARKRVDSQASDEDRRALADVVIDTSGSLEFTRAQVDELWNRIRCEPA